MTTTTMIERIAKRENDIKDAFWAHFRGLFNPSQYFVTQHQDVRKSGYPDNAVHGYGHCTAWEFKHATPNFLSHVLQEVTCCKIDRHSFCRYVLFYETADEIKTCITRPMHVLGRLGKFKDIHCEFVFDGHSFTKLAQFIHVTHRYLRIYGQQPPVLPLAEIEQLVIEP